MTNGHAPADNNDARGHSNAGRGQRACGRVTA